MSLFNHAADESPKSFAERTLEAALENLREGIYSIPVPRGEKGPKLKEWQKLRLDEAGLREVFGDQELNIGVLLGEPSGGLADVDLDCDEAIRLAEQFLPPTPRMSGRKSRPKSHFWYRCPEAKTTKFQDQNGKSLVELRSTGGQTIVPPSLHPSGESYEWDEYGPLPTVEHDELIAGAARLAAGSLLARNWPSPDSRPQHHAALAIADFLLRGGLDLDLIKKLIAAAVPAVGDEQILDWIKTAEKIKAGEPAAGVPRAADVFGPKVLELLSKWLRLHGEKHTQESELLPTGQAGIEDLLFPEAADQLDLRTAAGVREGGRHDMACRLVGAHLGRGDDPLFVVQWAYQWADRCDPPIERDELFRIAFDLHRKDMARREEEPAKEEAPWPTLDPAAYYGLAGEIVKAIEPQTEADPVAILVQLFVFFGNVIGRNAYYLVEATKHYANQFAVLVGQTSKGRKGTSEARVRELFESIHDDWLLKRILHGLSSGEGLIWAVRDPIEEKKPVKKGGRIIDHQMVVSDDGIADKRLLVIEAEFAAVLRIAKRDGNTLSPTIRSAWDSGTLQIMTKNSPARATGAHISIIGHITKEELRACLTEVEGFNGFANRFEWICVKRSKLLPEGGAPVDLSSLRSRLETAIDFAKSPRHMERDPCIKDPGNEKRPRDPFGTSREFCVRCVHIVGSLVECPGTPDLGPKAASSWP